MANSCSYPGGFPGLGVMINCLSMKISIKARTVFVRKFRERRDHCGLVCVSLWAGSRGAEEGDRQLCGGQPEALEDKVPLPPQHPESPPPFQTHSSSSG